MINVFNLFKKKEDVFLSNDEYDAIMSQKDFEAFQNFIWFRNLGGKY